MTSRAASAASFFAAALLVFAAPASAHKGHASPSPSAVVTPSSMAAGASVEADTDQAAPAGSPSAAEAVTETPAPSEPAEAEGVMAVIPWQTALTGHLHNKIVHFPLAFGLAAAVMLMVAPRWPAYEPAARVLLIVGAVAAVAAYLTGTAQEEPFEDSPFHSVVELHETFGIATALALAIGAALSFRATARRLMPFYGAVLLLLLAATGFLGGVLSHS